MAGGKFVNFPISCVQSGPTCTAPNGIATVGLWTDQDTGDVICRQPDGAWVVVGPVPTGAALAARAGNPCCDACLPSFLAAKAAAARAGLDAQVV